MIQPIFQNQTPFMVVKIYIDAMIAENAKIQFIWMAVEIANIASRLKGAEIRRFAYALTIREIVPIVTM